MNTAQLNNSEKLLTLKEASHKLNVPVETLLSWNEHNILKPTITADGAVGYTERQLEQFSATIQKVIQHAHPTVTQHTAPVVQRTLPVEKPAQLSLPEDSSDEESIKQFSSKSIISFAVILILLTLIFTQDNQTASSSSIEEKQPLRNVLGMHTSTFNLSEKLLSGLPIQLTHQPSEKELEKEQAANAFRQKTIASILYASKPAVSEGSYKTSTSTAKQTPNYRPNSTIAVNTNSYAATALFQSSQDEGSAIDEHGNIRGNAEEETLAMVVGNIDEQIKTNSLKQSSTHATNQLLLIFLGMFAMFFGIQKQLAFTHRGGKKITHASPVYIEPAAMIDEKVLEVDQKTDGTVVLYVNGSEYKISKPEMNSESDQFIEKLMGLTQPNLKEIEYDTALPSAIKFATPLSRLVTRLGFVGIKRDLFFPRTSKTSVLFRRYLTKQDLIDMNITLDHIRNELDLLS